MSTNTFRCDRLRSMIRVSAAVGALSLAAISSVHAAALDRIRETGQIKFGYFADVRPFTYVSGSTVAGYGAALCQRIADHVKGELGIPTLAVEWVPIQPDNALAAVAQGSVDALCTPTAITVGRRKEVSYSLPVFPGGARAVLRNDAPAALKTALAEAQPPKPVWRGSPAVKTVKDTRVGVVSGSATQAWAIGKIAVLQIGAQLVPVPDYKTGLEQLRDRQIDVFFGERSAVLGAMDPSAFKDLTIVDRMFTHELYGIALGRGEEDLRLLVDRALSLLYSTGEIDALYQKSFGPPSAAVKTFFQWNALPL
jgi:ABC-type amino acid transport substrate-binding protein